ncbi:Amino acid transporter [Mycobacterium numidiamassiliense]|uniref:Amino acid transporter n=1 Tax=Mycobacterium numidiamassiliense TaxID=1841861 RepID=A0A2U3P7X2_9MYCO|nr:APC family permease [Mycobacterium numidiamassiliense]SPM39852.1 Amino acid transporter [Mycobacterium numidiamassiliense]
MSQALTGNEVADEICRDCGYEPELKRSLNGFQIFAVAFAAMSVVMGVFATYDDMLRSSGPVGIWLFPVIGVGQLLVALVYAQFSARIPLSGGPYAWASRLASPKIGWGFGWLAFLNAVTSPVAIDNALATQCLMPLFDMEPNETTGRVITVVLLVIQAALAIAATRIVGWVNSLSVVVEFGILVVLGIAFTVAVLMSGDGKTANLFSHGVAEGNPNYYLIGGGLMGATIMGLNTLVGFESAANMAEEAADATRTVPRAIIGSVVASSVLGFLFLIVLTIAVKDIPAASASASPVAEVMRQQFGPVLERPFLAVIAIAFFGAALVAVASASRYNFAMARDGRFPGHRVFQRVNPRTHTPIPATLLVMTTGIVLIIALPGAALFQLIATSTIISVVQYMLTSVLYLGVRRKFDRAGGGFDLGRWDRLVAVAALVWLIICIFTVLVSFTTLATLLVVLGLLGLGFAYFLYMWKFDREVLEHEPGESDLFTVSSE